MLGIIEEWKVIPDTDGYYEVSNTGIVRSKDRITTGGIQKQVRKGKVLAAGIDTNGYKFVNIYRHKKIRSAKIHSLVAEAFLGPRPAGLIIHHKDGNQLNNMSNNLEYTSYSKNTKEYWESKGKRRPKLSINNLREISLQVDNGRLLKEIADKLGISYNDLSATLKVVQLW